MRPGKTRQKTKYEQEESANDAPFRLPQLSVTHFLQSSSAGCDRILRLQIENAVIFIFQRRMGTITCEAYQRQQNVKNDNNKEFAENAYSSLTIQALPLGPPNLRNLDP